MTDEQKGKVEEGMLISREISILKDEIESGREEIKREQNRFAEQLKRGLGEKILKDVKPKSKIITFFKKLFAIYG